LGLLLASSCFRKYSDKKNTNKTEKLYLHAISGTVLHYVLAKSREVSFKLVLRHLYLAHVVEFLFREFFHNGIVLLLFDIPLTAPPRAGLCKRGARLETLSQGRAQWRVQKFLRGASSHNDKYLMLKSDAWRGNTKIGVSGTVP